MKHASLFSGIGGFDLAAEWMGWENVFNCEIDPFCKRVLKYHFPNAIQYGDIKNADFSIHKGQIDILTGGFPCQPFSQAGKRLGTEDERHLWPEMLRAIHEIQPTWVVGENVLGIVNWDGGLVFNEVQSDLEAAGYEVQPVILPAVAVNAPHRRDRVWFVAYSESNGKHGISGNNTIKAGENGTRNDEFNSNCSNAPYADSERQQREGELTIRRGAQQFEWFLSERDASNTEITGSERECEQRQGEVQSYGQNSRTIPPGFDNFPTQPPICGGDDGLPRTLDGITFSKWRNESIKAYGNAIVPQVAFQIFKTIQAYEDEYYK